MIRAKPFTLTGTSPAAPGTAILATVRGLARYSAVRIDAVLAGATGGVLDVYLQRQVAPGVWLDWCHFPQLAAAPAVANYSAYTGDTEPNINITSVGQMNDDGSVGAPALAANTFVGGLPGDAVRLVAVAGTGTSAGALQTVTLTGEELFT